MDLRESADSISGLLGDEFLGSEDSDELLAFENRGVPTIDRISDSSEARADERQDVTTSLNFPLHWTTARESWDYLYEFAIACELLGPRPDDRILDLAAGTCWATEFLTRFGVRTVSIDLSVEMLRRGRERLATDSRLVFRDTAAFVVTRAQTLPFLEGSFDGIICLNALHHLPSYAEALSEVYRVLKPGGRAVFSEPGSAHASEPLSQFRMREEQVLEKPVSLPLIRRLAMHAGFRTMRVIPLRSAGTYMFDYSASPADRVQLQQIWADTLRLSASEHARFVLHKGEDPPLDTLLPAHKLTGQLQAQIILDRVSAVVATGETFTDQLRITNTGGVTWRVKGRRFGGQVTCGLKICNPVGEVLREDLGRTPLPFDLEPGETIELDMRVDGQLDPGRYELRYDMVVEGVTWFEFYGSPCPRRPLEVVR